MENVEKKTQPLQLRRIAQKEFPTYEDATEGKIIALKDPTVKKAKIIARSTDIFDLITYKAAKAAEAKKELAENTEAAPGKKKKKHGLKAKERRALEKKS